jgi:hypothetical protein
MSLSGPLTDNVSTFAARAFAGRIAGASRARTGDLLGAIRANLVRSSALRFVHALD